MVLMSEYLATEVGIPDSALFSRVGDVVAVSSGAGPVCQQLDASDPQRPGRLIPNQRDGPRL